MADTKITALAAITTVDPAADVLPIVDISDTSMAASGTTKKITSNQILGAGGTATLASATITGDLTVDTSTLKVDSTNNRVGILTASPRSGFALDVLGNVALGNSTTTTSNRLKLDCSGTAGNVAIMSFATAGTNKAFFGLSGGYLGDASSDAIIATDAAGAAIRFYTSDTGVEAGRINSTGVYVLKGGTTSANGVGVAFPATQVASSDANTLDDYEEGTWVGTLKGATTDPTIAVTATGRYTKVGRLVSVQISFSNVNTTGASGDAYIIGLPFANSSITVHGSAASYLALTFSGYLGSEADPGGTNISLFDIRSGNVWASAQHSAGTSRYINAELTYTVA
jgi:hypothetical protein